MRRWMDAMAELVEGVISRSITMSGCALSMCGSNALSVSTAVLKSRFLWTDNRRKVSENLT